MFPAAIQKASAPTHAAYGIAMPLSLLLWLLPLFGGC